MTQIGDKSQIRQLIAQHMSQIQSMMAEVDSKQSEAIYAGFVANREEQRSSALEGEISLWQSKKAVGDTATTQMQYSQIQAAEAIRHKVEHKVNELEQQKKSVSGFISFLKEKLESMQTGNPVIDLFISMMETFVDLCESLLDAKKDKEALLEQSSEGSDLELTSLIEGSEDNAVLQKELEKSLMAQSKEKEIQAFNKDETFNKDIKGKESQETKLNAQQEQLVDKIYNIQQELQKDGKELPFDKLMSIANVDSGQDKKLVIDKTLSSVFDDLAAMLGQDKVVVNRRDNPERRDSSDRRGDQGREDTVERRTDERRQSDITFLG